MNCSILIKGISFVIAFIGILSIIAAFTSGSHGKPELMAPGIGLLAGSVFAYGFSYIVEAAYLYIEKREEESRSSAEDSE